MRQEGFSWTRADFEGDARKDAGTAQVLANTHDSYAQAFERAARVCMAEEFTSEDLTIIAGQPPNHPNAVGALMRKLAKQGLIVPTGKWTKAKRPNQHSAMLQVWRRAC